MYICLNDWKKTVSEKPGGGVVVYFSWQKMSCMGMGMGYSIGVGLI